MDRARVGGSSFISAVNFLRRASTGSSLAINTPYLCKLLQRIAHVHTYIYKYIYTCRDHNGSSDAWVNTLLSSFLK